MCLPVPGLTTGATQLCAGVFLRRRATEAEISEIKTSLSTSCQKGPKVHAAENNSDVILNELKIISAGWPPRSGRRK